MNTSESLLLLLSVVFSLAIPIYLIFREKMTGKGVLDYLSRFFPSFYQKFQQQIHTARSNFTRRRIIKLTSLNLLFNTIAAAYSAVFFLNLRVSTSSPGFWVLMGIYILLVCFTFYGMGIYITAIVIEAYTKDQLQKIDAFKIQSQSINLFHSWVSHFFICSGWIGVITVLGLIDFLYAKPQLVVSPHLLTLGGASFATVSALSQLLNRTAVLQLATAAVMYLIFFSLLILFPRPLSHHAMTIFAKSVLVFYNLELIFLVGRRVIRSESLRLVKD